MLTEERPDGSVVVGAGRLLEARERLAQSVELELLGLPELDRVGGEVWAFKVVLIEPAFR